MIIGDKFIWLHFPKCAGSFTDFILRKYYGNLKEIVFDEIDPSNVIWHQNVIEREKISGIDLSGKDIVCNFRRLPFWIISRIRYEKLRSGISVSKKMYVEGSFYEANYKLSHADNYIYKYTERKVNQWIRQENLYTDFMKAFSNYFNLDIIDESDFDRKVNTTGKEPELKEWFSKEELTQLYRSCPQWTRHEKFLYGNILTEDADF